MYSKKPLYTGQVDIDRDRITGQAYAIVMAFDNTGNRGDEIEQGASIQLDTKGP
jgi:hypothetical protein